MKDRKNYYAEMARWTQDWAQRKPEDEWVTRAILNHWIDLAEAKEKGKLIGWINFGMIPEILYAMNIVPHMGDHIATWSASFPEKSNITHMIDLAHEYMPDYMCYAGPKALFGLIKSGRLSKPDLMIGGSHPCDSSRGAQSFIAEYFGIPYFMVDVPYWDNEASHNYVAIQIQEMVQWLEEQTNTTLNIDKLREVITYSNEAQRYTLNIRELRKNTPCPTGGIDLLVDVAVNMSLTGTSEAVDYFKERCARAEKNVAMGKGVVSKENLRLVMLYALPNFDTEQLYWLENTFGAVFVECMLDFRPYPLIEDLSMEGIFRGLAYRVMNLPMAMHFRGPADYFIDRLALHACREYKADGATFLASMGCRSAWALGKLTKDRLLEELDVPMLNLEIDTGDPRVVPKETIRNRMEDFISLLMFKKYGRSAI